MSLFKQLLLAIGLLLTLAYAGIFLVSLESSRAQQLAQLQSHAQDAATALGLSLGDHLDDPQMAGLLVSAMFDSGYFERIRVVYPADGQFLAEHSAPAGASRVPARYVGLHGLP